MLLLRLSVFAFFIAAVVHMVRRFNPEDRRVFTSVGWAMGTALVAALAIFVGSVGPVESTGSVLTIFWILSLLPLAGALWVVIYAGQLLGDGQGGYWVKAGRRPRDAVLWSVVAVTGLLVLNGVLCRFNALPLSPAPTGQAAVSRVITQLGFSMGEEFLYRGCVQALLVSWLARFRSGRWVAVGLAALIFAVQHLAPVTQLGLIFLPAGVVFGLLFARFGLWPAAAAHFGANLAMMFVLPHLV